MKYTYVFCLLFLSFFTACSPEKISGKFYQVNEDSENFESPRTKILEIRDSDGKVQHVDTEKVNSLFIARAPGSKLVRIKLIETSFFKGKILGEFDVPLTDSLSLFHYRHFDQKFESAQINQNFDLRYRVNINRSCEMEETICSESCTTEESQTPPILPKCRYAAPRTWTCKRETCTNTSAIIVSFINPANGKINYSFHAYTNPRFDSSTPL